jgi:hypothetical protein
MEEKPEKLNSPPVARGHHQRRESAKMERTLKMQSERQRFEIEVDGHSYRAERERTRYNGWKWQWAVHGGSVMRSRYCDESGRTYKRVVAAAERELQAMGALDNART